jgi:hypothetical protein
MLAATSMFHPYAASATPNLLVWCPALELTTAPSRSRLRINASERRALASGMRDTTLANSPLASQSAIQTVQVYSCGGLSNATAWTTWINATRCRQDSD